MIERVAYPFGGADGITIERGFRASARVDSERQRWAGARESRISGERARGNLCGPVIDSEREKIKSSASERARSDGCRIQKKRFLSIKRRASEHCEDRATGRGARDYATGLEDENGNKDSFARYSQ